MPKGAAAQEMSTQGGSFGREVQEVRERGGRCFVRALFMRRLRRSLGAVWALLVVPALNTTAPE